MRCCIVLGLYKKLSLQNAGTKEKSALTLAPFPERTVIQILGDKTFTCCPRSIVGQKIEASTLVVVNWKFVKTGSNIYFGNNCKFLSCNSVLANLCSILFLKKRPFLEVSVPFFGQYFADSTSGC